MERDEQQLVPLPHFPAARREGYDRLSVDRWVATATRELAEAAERVRAAEQHPPRAAVARPTPSEQAGSVLDHALTAIIQRAGVGADGVLDEAKAQAVALVTVAQRQAELLLADAQVRADRLEMERRAEVEAGIADRVAQLERLNAEVEVARAARQSAQGLARSAADQLVAAAKALEVPLPRRAVIDLTDGSRPAVPVPPAPLPPPPPPLASSQEPRPG